MFGFCLHLFLGLRLEDEYQIHLEGLLAASGNHPIIPVAQKAGAGFRILTGKLTF